MPESKNPSISECDSHSDMDYQDNQHNIGKGEMDHMPVVKDLLDFLQNQHSLPKCNPAVGYAGYLVYI
ncbi:MAG: hypothetical protein B7Z63_05420 [Ignavibacteriae bacterium 37-53-5]|nr:MAG: hypothetical protein B7Z63_05420 [Ignavibacteriae bacterium 37-53-5]